MSLLHAIGSPSPKLNNNYALICLSWIFARCPPEVQNKMIAALDSIPSGGQHALLAPRSSTRVVVHGLGRVVTDRQLIRTLGSAEKQANQDGLKNARIASRMGWVHAMRGS
jgi:hypothetical protein